MPKRFMWRGADVYLPITFERGQVVEGVRGVHLLGRLKPGITRGAGGGRSRADHRRPEEARAGAVPRSVACRPAAVHGDVPELDRPRHLGPARRGRPAAADCLRERLEPAAVEGQRAAARDDGPRRRSARAARRLVRQLLTESLILALAAGVVGTALAYAGLPAILALVPPDTIPDEAEISLNLPVLIFALVVSALHERDLRPGAGAAHRGQGRRRMRCGKPAAASRAARGRRSPAKSLVVAEVALSLMLLAGSSVLLRAFVADADASTLEAPPERILTLRVPLAPPALPGRAAADRLLPGAAAANQALPGVEAVGVNSGLHPFGNMSTAAEVSGEPPITEPVQAHKSVPATPRRSASGWPPGDCSPRATSKPRRRVALVNERFVRTRVPGRPPLGQTVRLPRLKDPPFNVVEPLVPDRRGRPRHAERGPGRAGHAGDLRAVQRGRAARTCWSSAPRGIPPRVTRAVVSQVYAVDAGQPVTNVTTLAQLLKEEEFATPRFNLILLSVFATGRPRAGGGRRLRGDVERGGAGAAGDRRPHGARRRCRHHRADGHRARLAAAAGRDGRRPARQLCRRPLAGGAVWRVSGFDPVAFGAVALLLLVVGLQACYWPARRAARIDPLIAIRETQ